MLSVSLSYKHAICVKRILAHTDIKSDCPTPPRSSFVLCPLSVRLRTLYISNMSPKPAVAGIGHRYSIICYYRLVLLIIMYGITRYPRWIFNMLQKKSLCGDLLENFRTSSPRVILSSLTFWVDSFNFSNLSPAKCMCTQPYNSAGMSSTQH